MGQGTKLGANLYKRLYGYFQSQRRSIEDGEKAIREIDLKSVENGQFFDIGGVIPVREGYTFAGWSFSPSGERNRIIANTANSDWFADWESYYRSLQYGENPASTSNYDIQLYAVWEKNVTELTNSDTNVFHLPDRRCCAGGRDPFR